MAADSRMTLTAPSNITSHNLSFEFSNASRKVFCTKGSKGISACGQASIRGKPIAGFIEDFARESDEPGVEITARALVSFIRKFDPDCAVVFHVAGYNSNGTQSVFQAFPAEDAVVDMNPKGSQGACWSGETDVLMRVCQHCATLNDDNSVKSVLPRYVIPYEFFNLQDAIDYALFAATMTAGAIRFQNRPKTVGGPIDVLVVKPEGIEWVREKKLHI